MINHTKYRGVTMSKTTKRGYSPENERDFTGLSLDTLRCAKEDLYFFLNHGYPIKGASTFIGNHHLLSERQRVALTRIVSEKQKINERLRKQEWLEHLAGETIQIDGFNTIITIEVALSGSPIFKCMDGTCRDLAGLRGTYSLIDKTDIAIKSILAELQKHSIKKAVFWLDAPVSNSGRLKCKIAEIAEAEHFDVQIEITNDVDKELYAISHVVTSDSIILDHCKGWVNLNECIISHLPNIWMID